MTQDKYQYLTAKHTDVLIHIGYPKTGTTHLQKKVFPQLKVNHYCVTPMEYIGESEIFEPKQYIDLLVKRYGYVQDKPIIVSQEALSGKTEGGGNWNPFRIARRLRSTFPHAKILAVVRNQLTYIQSLYGFRVVRRGQETHSLSSYLDRHFEGQLEDKLQYHGLIDHYVSLFGKENVLILTYEHFASNPHSYVQAILDFAHIDADLSFTREHVNRGARNLNIIRANRVANLPIAYLSAALCRCRFYHTDRYVRTRFYSFKRRFLNPPVEAILKRRGPALLLEKEWKARLIEVYRASNHILQDYTDDNLKAYGYPW